jgi:hypothetical protein
MVEDFEKLLQLAQDAKTATFDVERLWQHLVSEFESDSDLFAPVDFMQAALACLDQHGGVNERLQRAAIDFVQRTGMGDYAAAFNDLCEESHQDLYIELPESTVCQTSTEDRIRNVRAYGLYYTRRRLSELWTSPEVSPNRVASLLTDYLADFRKARASDEHVANILNDMLTYGYLDELCGVAKASRTRSACNATSEARKVVAAEQALVRSMDAPEFALVSFLAENLSEHKTFCLREYNRKEQNRTAAQLSNLQERQNEDRDDYGQIQRRRTLAPPSPLSIEPDASDLAVLKRPYWLYCEKGGEHYWVGDHSYHDFIVSYTDETAPKLRFEDDPTWITADLGITHGRLQSFAWHSPVEEFIEVQQAIGVTPITPPVPEPVHLPDETAEPSHEPAPSAAAEPAEIQPVKRRVGYTLESIADRLRQEQDAVMRTSPVGITLIAGAAGSGKTNVAFHRIDYLLQEHSDRFSQRNIAVFAPKTSLAKYLRELASSFQFWLLPIYSYDDWAMGILSNFTDANRVAAAEDLELSQRKSSVAMLDLMRRYLNDKTYELETQIKGDIRLQEYTETIDGVFQQPPTSLIGLYTTARDALWGAIDARHELDGPAISASRAPAESSLTRVLYADQNQPSLIDDLDGLLTMTFRAFPGFKKEYEMIRTRLEVYRQPVSWLQREIWARGASERTTTIEAILVEFLDLMFSEKRVQQLVLRRIRSEKNRVNARLRTIFRRVCFVSLYAHPPTHLVSACETPFLVHIYATLMEFYRSPYCWDYLGLTETPEQRFEVFELSRTDVDVAMWLIYQISSENLAQEPTANFLHIYDHVVVDEAQDFTPLQLLLLHRLSHNSMTMAGDLTQRIFDTGIRDWDDLREPIDNRYVLTMSHRTTLETALFAKALMRDASSATLAERVAYHGERPLVMQCRDDQSAVSAAIDYVGSIKANNPGASVLLVHPRNAALRGLREGLAAVGITGYVAKGDTWEFSEKVTVTTYRRVQGLEYDYVVVLGLNEFETMPMSGDKSHILYTLATRAKVQLVLCVRDPLPALLSGVDSALYDLR